MSDVSLYVSDVLSYGQEYIRKLSFTGLLDYRDDLRNFKLSYADGRSKAGELTLVNDEINKRVK